MNEQVLREGLLELLEMGSAHVTLEQALEGLQAEAAFRRPPATPSGNRELHSVWELLEHTRLAQEDIVNYTVDSSWESPPWPDGLWPKPPPQDADPAQLEQKWRTTLEEFHSDLERVRDWVRDQELRLTDQIPHGEGRTYLRQVLLVADHNAYHLGQIVSVRRLLGLWG